jgi:hypothetical protein
MNVWITPLTSAAGSLGGALVGAFVGGWLSDRREQRKRHADLIDRQLQQFYRPLRALRDTTRVYGDLLSKMNSSSPGLMPEQMAIADDDLTILKDKLVPIYRDMINVFRTNMSVADPGMDEYFSILNKYVESWEKSLRGAMLAHEWIVRGENEKVLQPFYEHLESTYNRLLDTYKTL